MSVAHIDVTIGWGRHPLTGADDYEIGAVINRLLAALMTELSALDGIHPIISISAHERSGLTDALEVRE